MNKFRIGDKVRIKDKTGYTYGICEETLKEMRKLKDIWTIESIRSRDKISLYTLKEERFGLSFFEDMLEKANYTYGDLKKAPIGTKITFQNGYLIKFDKERVYGVINGIYYNGKIDYIILFLKGKVTDERFGKIIKIEEPAYTTVYESKAEILDEAEKRYLRGVIRPFRDRVKYIQKFTFSTGKAKITIKTEKDNDTWYVSLPLFEKDSMYKNMKPDKEYTLEELGL